MSQSRRFQALCLLPGLASGLCIVGSAQAQQPEHPTEPIPPVVESQQITDDSTDEDAIPADGEMESENAVEQTQDVQRPLESAPAPVQPAPAAPAAQSELARAVFGGARVNESLLSAVRKSRAGQPGTDVVMGREGQLRTTTDAGSLLSKSNSAAGIGSQKRSPIVTDTIVRGSGAGRTAASGSYWFPARFDLDTMLSKIDSRLIGDMIVIKGPYAARYGPGFSFVDFDLLSSPRYQDGFETHGSTNIDYKTNGEQWYGRQNVWGGDADWGFRAGYGHRTGNDYETGDGTDMPSSYKSRDFNFSIGCDPSPDSHIEFTYLRLDQTDVEFPGQVFDIDFLKTDSFEVKYVLENQCCFDTLTFETWYNATHFKGNAQRSGKRRQIPNLDEIGFIGFTDVNNMSTGFSLSLDWVGCDNERLTVGADMRYLKQRLDEIDRATVDFDPPNGSFAFGNGEFENFPIPKSHSVNPGIFLESEQPISDRLKVKTGGRIDWVNTNATSHVRLMLVSDPGTSDLEEFLGANFDQYFNLGSAFVTAEYTLCDHWTASAAGGFAMRPPTMTELYAISPFLTVMPQFASTAPFGNPELESERRWQIDLGVQAKYTNCRAGVNAFHAWVDDYITLDLIFINDLEGTGQLPLYGFVNTELATLAGFETYGEYDVNRCTTAFATMSFVEGRDHRRIGNNFLGGFGVNRPRSDVTGHEEPLYAVSPLEARVGFRIQEPTERRYGVELAARIVDDQNRVATSLLESETPGFTTYDVRGFWRVCKNLMLVSGVENLTDKQYREHLDSRNFSSVFQPGVNFYFGAELTY